MGQVRERKGAGATHWNQHTSTSLTNNAKHTKLRIHDQSTREPKVSLEQRDEL